LSKLNISYLKNYLSQQEKIKNIFVLPTKCLSTTSTNTNDPSTSSVDSEEMKRFSLMSKSWWVENGEFEALHRMNVLRVPLVRDALINYRNSCIKTEENYTCDELLREPLLGLNILDVGCGGGILSEPLARLGANVTGIDTCKDNVIASELRAQTEFEKSNGMSRFYERLRYLNCNKI
jgi:2-polyprenyl-3-methyl-5-hydroxy-6-metoxy-1,4-benzoquinol methylase